MAVLTADSENLTNNPQKRCEIGCTLVLFVNKKSHMVFRLVLKVVTLHDVEPRNGRYIAHSNFTHSERYSYRSQLR